jgi:Protein of unknown function (DUF3617)
MPDSTTYDRRSLPLTAAARDVSLAAVRPLSPVPYPKSLLALLAFLTLPAFAQDFPKLKSGLWEMERTLDPSTAHAGPPMPLNRTSMCLDQSVQREMFDMAAGAMKGACSRQEFKLTGNRMTGDVVCDLGGSTMHSKSLTVLDGNTAYRTDIDTTYDPPLMGRSHSKMVIAARNVGPCKPGQRAGDVVLPNGQTVNMHDMINGPHGTQGTITPGAPPQRPPR